MEHPRQVGAGSACGIIYPNFGGKYCVFTDVRINCTLRGWNVKDSKDSAEDIDRDYYVSSHAEDEMLDDELERADIENAIFKGRIEKKLTEDIRGTRYRIEGPARDGRSIHVVCRFKEVGNLVIITAYALTEEI